MKKFLMQYKYTIVAAILLASLYFLKPEPGSLAVGFTMDYILQFITLLPPVFILIGLLDVWVPKETMIRYLGKGTGWRGVGIIFLLGSLSAGPLYVAFPIALLLLKKGARLALVVFFLGVWSSTKIPILIFEFSSLGTRFTLYHMGTELILYLLTGLLMERFVSEKEILTANSTESII